MRTYLKQGWSLTKHHRIVIVLLFIYELLWNFLAYRLIDQIVTALLQRYPAQAGKEAVALFWMEGQFRLLDTDLIQSYLWLFGGLLLCRMIVTPLMTAGLLHSFRHATPTEGTQFIRGMRLRWGSMTILYGTKLILILLPIAVIVLTNTHPIKLILERWPLLTISWIIWQLLLHGIFVGLQLGVVNSIRPLNIITVTMRCLPLYTVVSILLGLIGLLFSAAMTGLTLLLPGIMTLILYQSGHLLHILLKVWLSASHYHIWQSKQ
jgi:hypothetical protein